MRYLTVASLAFLFCGACGGEPAPAVPPAATPGKTAVRWELQQGLWGKEVFEVEAGGKARYSFVPVRPSGKAENAEATLTAADLDALARTLKANDFCALRSTRMPVPDEATPSLEVDLPGVRCLVALVDGEWRDEPRAQACQAAVMELILRVKAAGG